MSLLVGKKAPSISGDAVVDGRPVEEFTLSQFQGKYVVLFFYPLDFTFVCPTELHAFQEKLQEFHDLDTQVIGCSIDSAYSHLAWLNTPKNKGGIQGVTYPILADVNKKISEAYDVLLTEKGIAYRGLFLIDRDGIVRHQMINDLPLGRSVDEVLRMVRALQFHEENGEVCPANWNKGDTALKPTTHGLETYFAAN